MQGMNTPPIQYLTSHPRASTGGEQTGWNLDQPLSTGLERGSLTNLNRRVPSVEEGHDLITSPSNQDLVDTSASLERDATEPRLGGTRRGAARVSINRDSPSLWSTWTRSGNTLSLTHECPHAVESDWTRFMSPFGGLQSRSGERDCDVVR